MAEVQHMKDRGIPLKVEGVTRFVKGATKYTTCSDVIKMVLKKTGIRKEYRHLFVIYEVSNDIEIALPCKDRIMKVVESWKDETKRLVLRKSDPLTPLPLTEKTKKWKLKKKAKEEHTVKERRNPFKHVFNKQDKTTDKQHDRIEPQVKEATIPITSTSSSDSDSSLEEFLSNLDHSKMTGLINFFVAMTKKSNARANHNQQSASSLESNASSNNSPIRKKKTLRKRRNSRSTKRLREKNRMPKASDFHPNKMHAVKRVNFGFIDAEPRTYDHCYSQLDVRTAEGTVNGRPRSESYSTKLQSVRRRLIPSSRQSTSSHRYSSGSSSSHQDSELKNSSESCSSFEEESYTRPCKMLRLQPEEMYGTVCGNKQTLIDSGHEDDSDTSTDLDTAFVGQFNMCGTNATPHGAIEMQDIDTMNLNHKLVNYSITDDELDKSDSVVHKSHECVDYDVNVNGVSCNVSVNQSIEHGVMNSTIDEIRASMSDRTRKFRVKRNIGSATGISSKRNAGKTDVTNYIKSIFRTQCENEDDEMNSFMKSMVLDDSSDEGLCSLGSDQEKEDLQV